MSKSKMLVTIDVEYPIENYTVHGIVKLNCKENIRIESIRGEFNNTIRGNLQASILSGVDFHISNYTTITSGVEYEFPFSFSIRGLDFIDYKGINVNIIGEIVVIIKVDEEDFPKVETSIISILLSKLTSNNDLEFYKVVELTPKSCQYRAVEESKLLQLSAKQSVFYISILITSVIIGSIFYYYQFFNIFALIFALLFVGIISAIIVTSTLRKIFESVQVQIRNSQEGLEFNFSTPQLFKLRNLTFYYQVFEKIEDRRGTSTSTINELRYQSPDKLIGSGWQKIVQANFPKKNGLQTLEVTDVEVYWEVNLRGYWMGLPFIFEVPFKVECK